ncbi:M48 family metalloprotease [Cytobacillus oceanisediminis]|uniref:M48 family metalloprotease n=1 Tax=Cytobacillus oceanisediminis TaxID=665099 RepID=UPI001FB43646|nr:M48 family metalloprotease [Cytobacillus oceanisediminis]UOE53489.1 M48 family metalloprotease [Cytobacillus oceanisediminis]
MYLVSFLKNLKKKSNWGIIVYMLLNCLLFLPLFQSGTNLRETLSLIFFCVLFYLISLAAMLSPLGEFILRLRTGSRPIKRRDLERKLRPLFDNVYQKAKIKDPTLPGNIKLFIHKSPIPNAFAVGRKTVCVTQGLLDIPEDEIEAILAHEFGHLSHKDTDFLLAITVGNIFVNIALWFIRLIWIILTIPLGIVLKMLSEDVGEKLHGVIIQFPVWAWTRFGLLFIQASSRQNEFEADRFAADLGYGSELASALDRVAGQSPDIGILKAMYSTHPDTDERIGRLQDLGAEYVAY